MMSSYTNNINYGDIFAVICRLHKPKTVVEFGVLQGYSLKHIVDNVDKSCKIIAYDIFEEFNGNSANKTVLLDIFNRYTNVSIEYGDFYKVHEQLGNSSIDIIHIDIANNGEVFKFAVEKYFEKLTDDGLLILEGGSNERDNVDWMIKYNKPKIIDFITEYSDKYDIFTIGTIPSVTLLQRRHK
jgi:predicted O-methyltransferase YrrM